MKLLSWNVRGLGQPRAFPSVRELVKTHKADIVFLSETLSDLNKIEDLRVYLGFAGALGISCVGHSGGLAILWHNITEISVNKFSTNFIDMNVSLEGDPPWRLTGFYGFLDSGRRRQSWNLLLTIAGFLIFPSVAFVILTICYIQVIRKGIMTILIGVYKVFG